MLCGDCVAGDRVRNQRGEAVYADLHLCVALD
jgi:hypothetical protein